MNYSIIKNGVLKNFVIREIRDFEGNILGYAKYQHNGQVAGIMESAQKLTSILEQELGGWSNINSRIFATDESGKIKWAISPNFKHLAEIETDEAQNIWGFIQCSF